MRIKITRPFHLHVMSVSVLWVRSAFTAKELKNSPDKKKKKSITPTSIIYSPRLQGRVRPLSRDSKRCRSLQIVRLSRAHRQHYPGVLPDSPLHWLAIASDEWPSEHITELGHRLLVSSRPYHSCRPNPFVKKKKNKIVTGYIAHLYLSIYTWNSTT